MSSSSKFRNFCIKMTLPVWNKWHSSHDDCRAGLARMWRRGKMLLLALAADVWFEHIWIKDEVNYWSMESNLWSLNIEMVSFTIRYVESNLCGIEMNNGTVCGIRFACFFQHATSRLLCLFCSFLRTCTDECFFSFFFRWISCGFSVCFASYSHLGSTVWYWKWIVFLFGCFFCLTNVKIRCVWMKLKVPRRIRRK